jgi:hypothetical protein
VTGITARFAPSNGNSLEREVLMTARLPEKFSAPMYARTPTDRRNLQNVLRFELNYLEHGGYTRSLRAPWRALCIFEDSPACPNYESQEYRVPCDECALLQLVPLNARTQKIPCRHIRLTPQGETLESLYRTGTQQEIEEAVGAWLRATIQSLETERGLVAPGVTALALRALASSEQKGTVAD